MKRAPYKKDLPQYLIRALKAWYGSRGFLAAGNVGQMFSKTETRLARTYLYYRKHSPSAAKESPK